MLFSQLLLQESEIYSFSFKNLNKGRNHN